MKEKCKIKKINSIDAGIGERIRVKRITIGMSQQTLGDNIGDYIERDGLSFQQIQKYERGIDRVSGSTLYAICKILETSPDKIMGWEVVEPLAASRRTLELVKMYSRCNDNSRFAIQQLTSTLAEV